MEHYFCTHRILEGDDRGGSVPVYGREIEITPSKASHIDSPIPGSNKVSGGFPLLGLQYVM